MVSHLPKVTHHFLFKEWHTRDGIFLHPGFIYFNTDARFITHGDKAVVHPFPIVINDLFEHWLGMKIRLPFKDHKVGHRSAYMRRSHCAEERSHHMWCKRHVI